MPSPQRIELVTPRADAAGPLEPDPVERALLELLERIDGRLANLEAKLAEYEPLAQLARDRAERGSRWSRFGQGGNPNGG